MGVNSKIRSTTLSGPVFESPSKFKGEQPGNYWLTPGVQQKRVFENVVNYINH